MTCQRQYFSLQAGSLWVKPLLYLSPHHAVANLYLWLLSPSQVHHIFDPIVGAESGVGEKDRKKENKNP